MGGSPRADNPPSPLGDPMPYPFRFPLSDLLGAAPEPRPASSPQVLPTSDVEIGPGPIVREWNREPSRDRSLLLTPLEAHERLLERVVGMQMELDGLAARVAQLEEAAGEQQALAARGRS